MIWTLELPGYIPTPLNKLSGHWGNRSRLKKKDREVIGHASVIYAGVNGEVSLRWPTRRRKRRVDLVVIWPKGRRSTDPDSLHKSVLDALVHSGVLVNDSAAWCELGKVRYAKSPDDWCATYITISEV